VLICFEMKVLLAGCWCLVCSERKVLLAGEPNEQGGRLRFSFYPQPTVLLRCITLQTGGLIGGPRGYGRVGKERSGDKNISFLAQTLPKLRFFGTS
jgi:hypothetical protein